MEPVQLYYYPGNASLAPHMTLRELGIPHELVLVDREADEHKGDAYLEINPRGLIPALVHGDLVFHESAAICLYLSDLRPGALAPPPGARGRARLYQWMCFLTNTIQPTLMNYHYPHRYGDGPDGEAAIQARAEAWAFEMFTHVNDALAERAFLLGGEVSICDLFLLMLCRWARTFERGPRQLPHLVRLLEELSRRPAVRATFERESIAEPYT